MDIIEHKNWLESLHVTTNGEILAPGKPQSLDLLLNKRQKRQDKKAKEASKQQVMDEDNDALLNQNPVFQDEETSSQSSESESRR